MRVVESLERGDHRSGHRTASATPLAGAERRALSRRFLALAPRIHQFFWRRFADASLADELVQRTFFLMHRAAHEYRTGSPVNPWIFTIAARVAATRARDGGASSWVLREARCWQRADGAAG